MKKMLFMALMSAAAALLSADLGRMLLFPSDFQHGEISFVEDYPLPLVFKFTGNRDDFIKRKNEICVELPEYLCLRQAVFRLGGNAELKFNRQSVTRDGGKYYRYRAALNNAILGKIKPDAFNDFGCLTLFVEAAPGSAGKKHVFQVWLEEDGKKTVERKCRGDILPRPPRPAKPLQDFAVGITSLSATGLPDQNILKRHTDFWHSLSARPFTWVGEAALARPKSALEFLNAHYRIITELYACRHSTIRFPVNNIRDPGFLVRSRVVRPGVPLFVDGGGITNHGAICPQYLLQDPEDLFWGKHFRLSMQPVLKTFPACKSAVLDYEPFITGGTCGNCRGDFARYAGLQSVPPREELRDGRPLNRKWRDYKIIQHRKILEKFVDAMRRNFPRLELILCCSAPGEDYRNSWDGVDSSTVAQQVDAFMPMNYNSGIDYFNTVAAQRKTLKGVAHYSLIDPSEESQRFFRRYTPGKVAQNLIATAALGADGIGIYPTDALDGKMLHAIARGCAAVGEVESLLAKGRNAKLAMIPRNVSRLELIDDTGRKTVVRHPDYLASLRGILREQNGVYALALFNYSGKEVFLDVAVPGYQGTGKVNIRDAFHNERHTGVTAEMLRSGFTVSLPVDGVRLFVIGGRVADGSEVSRASVAEALNKSLKKLATSENVYHAKSVGDAQLNWRSINGKFVAELRSGSQYLLIDPADGIARVWKRGSHTPVGGGKTVLGAVRFYNDRTAAPSGYRLDGFDLRPEYSELNLLYTVPPDTGFGEGNPMTGLTIRKTFRLHRTAGAAGRLELKTVFSNPTGTPKKFGFRIQNIPLAFRKPPTPPFALRLDGEPAQPNAFYIRPGRRVNWSSANPPVFRDFRSAGLSARWYDYEFSAPDASGFYSWSDGATMSAEMLFSDVLLQPGENREFRQEMIFRQK